MTEKATITIQPEEIIGAAHDHLYGANLEHIGQGIYGSLWAEMLRDRKFAGNDLMYTAPSEGLHNVHPSIGIVVPWEAQNPDYEAVRYVHDNTTYYTGSPSAAHHHPHSRRAAARHQAGQLVLASRARLRTAAGAQGRRPGAVCKAGRGRLAH